jgi:hypothetical protein
VTVSDSELVSFPDQSLDFQGGGIFRRDDLYDEIVMRGSYCPYPKDTLHIASCVPVPVLVPFSLTIADAMRSFLWCDKSLSIPRSQSFPSFAACSPDFILLKHVLDIQVKGSGSWPSGFRNDKTAGGSNERNARLIAGR